MRSKIVLATKIKMFIVEQFGDNSPRIFSCDDVCKNLFECALCEVGTG